MAIPASIPWGAKYSPVSPDPPKSPSAIFVRLIEPPDPENSAPVKVPPSTVIVPTANVVVPPTTVAPPLVTFTCRGRPNRVAAYRRSSKLNLLLVTVTVPSAPCPIRQIPVVKLGPFRTMTLPVPVIPTSKPGPVQECRGQQTGSQDHSRRWWCHTHRSTWCWRR